MDQSDASDISGQGAPDNARDPRRKAGPGGVTAESGDEEDAWNHGIKDQSHSWHETLMKFPSLIRLYPLADSSEFEGGGEGEELNGLPPSQSQDNGVTEAATTSKPDPLENLIA